ncbi:hypothetical protein CURTO8I2_170244 [Curtobacterium sp. 8I-2]|nr:hypothetical protein CURTO8I2_170244 [Curtobacterium sp. 8I-2]
MGRVAVPAPSARHPGARPGTRGHDGAARRPDVGSDPELGVAPGRHRTGALGDRDARRAARAGTRADPGARPRRRGRVHEAAVDPRGRPVDRRRDRAAIPRRPGHTERGGLPRAGARRLGADRFAGRRRRDARAARALARAPGAHRAPDRRLGVPEAVVRAADHDPGPPRPLSGRPQNTGVRASHTGTRVFGA